MLPASKYFVVCGKYKKLISWADVKEKKTCARTVPWKHCSPSYATMDKAWCTENERQVLKATIKDGRTGVRWDVDDWRQFIGDQRDVLEEMHLPRFRDYDLHVLIVRGDGLPCGARSWCQIACAFANHMQSAGTLLYNWTLDLALVSKQETDLVRVVFGETLKGSKRPKRVKGPRGNPNKAQGCMSPRLAKRGW